MVYCFKYGLQLQIRFTASNMVYVFKYGSWLQIQLTVLNTVCDLYIPLKTSFITHLGGGLSVLSLFPFCRSVMTAQVPRNERDTCNIMRRTYQDNMEVELWGSEPRSTSRKTANANRMVTTTPGNILVREDYIRLWGGGASHKITNFILQPTPKGGFDTREKWHLGSK